MSKELKIFGAIITGTLIFIVAAGILLSGGGGSTPSRTALAPKETLVRADSWTEGPKDAKVTVVEFADFECPACKAAEPIVQQVRKDYQGKILYVYRFFPLPSHQYGQISAQAAEAAGLQGKFWEMHDKLFANQPNFTTDELKSYAKDLGLDAAKFAADLDSDPVRQHVLNDKNDGNNVGIDATPTFFINGTQFTGVLALADFKKEIDGRLTR